MALKVPQQNSKPGVEPEGATSGKASQGRSREFGGLKGLTLSTRFVLIHMMTFRSLFSLLITSVTLSALPAPAQDGAETAEAPADRPNILWIVSEDNSTRWLGSYGNEQARTPNLDSLASRGFRYTHCFADAPVCATQRSTWITGVPSISLGTHPMRSSYAVPEHITVYPFHLRQAGYYTHNARKTDYNGVDAGHAWSSRGDDPAPWRRAIADQPWFCIVNIHASHESRAFGDVEKTRHDPEATRPAEYHPDLPTIHQNYARYHDAVRRMDGLVGKTLKMLEEDGLADDTIIIYNSDHGGVLPRSKRFLYDSGIHCPLIVRIPENLREHWPADRPGSAVEEMVSFHDIIPTILSLAGADVPEHMTGRAFLGKDLAEERTLHFAFRERMDERYDNARAVRGRRYLYIRNYAPWAPWMQQLDYLWRMRATQAWWNHWLDGETTEVTGRWFEPKMRAEELYDTLRDPDCVNNLADDPQHAQRLETMRRALRHWQLEMRDTALLPEFERAHRARENGVTIYEMARDPEMYDLPAYLDAADVATAADPANLPELLEMLESEDSAIRYWGTTGLLMLALGETRANAAENRPETAAALQTALEDESHEVRAYAAWALIELGRHEREARQTLVTLLEDQSYADLIVLNIIDWMREKALPLREQLETYAGRQDVARYNQRLIGNILPKLERYARERG